MPDATINLKVDFSASPARVFDALTTPSDMEVWVWGGIGRDAKATADPRVGGLYSVSVDVGEQPGSPFGSRWTMRGLYLKVEPPSKLIYTVHWDAPVGYNERGLAIDEVVTIDLVARDQGTELCYVHMGVPTVEAANAHARAILQTFEILRQLIADGG